ncbi:hypothetical protein BD626DRAFT_564874 [Schizophyllum amplum]|uniref:Uncharacterized protein n=1 Tax=Schizophyllum amplum TaxID=97359 RepID=A0A550CT87_9AGAR|nr:hypothetical protein BD626DRAFT_564874 [Auriculariopsis ampla]
MAVPSPYPVTAGVEACAGSACGERPYQYLQDLAGFGWPADASGAGMKHTALLPECEIAPAYNLHISSTISFWAPCNVDTLQSDALPPVLIAAECFAGKTVPKLIDLASGTSSVSPPPVSAVGSQHARCGANTRAADVHGACAPPCAVFAMRQYPRPARRIVW